MDLLLGLFTVPVSVIGMAFCIRAVRWLNDD